MAGRVCILACKNLHWNRRIIRQGQSLLAAGFEVTVAAAGLPLAEVRAAAPDIEFVELAWHSPLVAAARAALRPVSHPPGRRAAAPSRPAIALSRRLGPFIHLHRQAAFARNVRRCFADRRFDYVQAHDSHALPAAIALGRRHGARLIYDAVEVPDDRSAWALHGTPGWLAAREQGRLAAMIGRADAIATVSPGLVDHIVETYGVAAPVLVRNCPDYVTAGALDRHAMRRDLGLGEDARLVLFQNAFYPGQGIETLLESLRRLPESVHLAILGPAEMPGYSDRISALIGAAGLARRVHVLGPRPGDLLLRYAAGADIGVIPREPRFLNNLLSLPNRLFEMIMARLPVAAADFPDIAAIVEGHGVGRLFDPREPEDMARAIAEALAPEAMAAARAAADRAAQELCWANEAERFLCLFD